MGKKLKQRHVFVVVHLFAFKNSLGDILITVILLQLLILIVIIIVIIIKVYDYSSSVSSRHCFAAGSVSVFFYQHPGTFPVSKQLTWRLTCRGVDPGVVYNGTICFI